MGGKHRNSNGFCISTKFLFLFFFVLNFQPITTKQVVPNTWVRKQLFWSDFKRRKTIVFSSNMSIFHNVNYVFFVLTVFKTKLNYFEQLKGYKNVDYDIDITWLTTLKCFIFRFNHFFNVIYLFNSITILINNSFLFLILKSIRFDPSIQIDLIIILKFTISEGFNSNRSQFSTFNIYFLIIK